MGLVHADTPKVEISRQTQKRREPWSVCRQTFEKLDQKNWLKWLKAANKWFKRCHKVLVCRSVLRCSNLQFLFSTEDDPVHFARTLLTVTLKQIHHFKCKRSEIAATVTMSTDCNLQISLSMIALAFIFGRTHLFFRNTDPSDVSFLKKQPRVSALRWNCSQESPQPHFFIDISSNWRHFLLLWEQLLCF